MKYFWLDVLKRTVAILVASVGVLMVIASAFGLGLPLALSIAQNNLWFLTLYILEAVLVATTATYIDDVYYTVLDLWGA